MVQGVIAFVTLRTLQASFGAYGKLESSYKNNINLEEATYWYLVKTKNMTQAN